MLRQSGLFLHLLSLYLPLLLLRGDDHPHAADLSYPQESQDSRGRSLVLKNMHVPGRRGPWVLLLVRLADLLLHHRDYQAVLGRLSFALKRTSSGIQLKPFARSSVPCGLRLHNSV